MPLEQISRLIEEADKALRDNPLFLDEVVDEFEAARIRGLAVPTLRQKRYQGGGPVFIKSGRRVGYTRRALLEDIRACTRSSTSGA